MIQLEVSLYIFEVSYGRSSSNFSTKKVFLLSLCTFLEQTDKAYLDSKAKNGDLKLNQTKSRKPIACSTFQNSLSVSSPPLKFHTFSSQKQEAKLLNEYTDITKSTSIIPCKFPETYTLQTLLLQTLESPFSN